MAEALVIRGGQVLARDGATLLPANIVIEGDRITDVGPVVAAPEHAEEIDADGLIVLPGLINAHTHAHNNLMKGTADNWSLEEMLGYGPALLAGRSSEDQYVSAAIGAVEMLKTGCTAAYDLYMAVPAPTEASAEAVARAYGDAGMRAVIAPAVADIVFHRTVPRLMELLPAELRAAVERIAVAPTEGLLRMTEEVLRRWDGAYGGRIRAAVSPTIPGQCTDAFLEGCARLVREHGVGLHTHLAETKIQVVHALQRWDQTPAARLDQLGILSSGFVGAHGVWLTPDDIARLARAGASVAHNPTSNLKLGSGIAPVRELLDAGVNVALGTDGSMSSDNQNLFGALHFAGVVGKIRFPHDSERWVGAHDAWHAVTEGGARALGLTDDIGAIAPGRKADLALLRADSVYLRPVSNPIGSLVYAEAGSSVETVLVDGKVVLRDGQVLTLDESALRAQAQDLVDRLRARPENRQAWLLAEQLQPHIRAACTAAAAEPLPINRYAAQDGHQVIAR
jgi:guanine deaminase